VHGQTRCRPFTDRRACVPSTTVGASLPTRLRGARFALCLTIVAAFQLRSATAAVTEDVPLAGGTAAFAQSLGIEPVPDRARFMYEVTRLLYNTPEGRRPAADAALLAMRTAIARGLRGMPQVDTRPGENVPIPLSADFWANSIFRRRMTPREIIPAIVADRSASLICLGLSSLDDATLDYLADHPSILERAYERSVTAFGAFATGLRIENNRVIPPGGLGQAAPGAPDDAVVLWEAVVGEKVTRPDRFIAQLFELSEGRLAYLYDTIGQLDPPRRAFALGLSSTSAQARVERFRTLAASIDSFREAHLRTLPFGRASYDLTMTFTRLMVDEHGVPREPSARAFWARVFAGPELPDDAARQVRNVEEEPLDAAWLVQQIGTADVRLRAERLDQIAFGQRVFATVPPAERGDVLVALRALSRYRMLMWTLERMGITTPALYASAARHAARLAPIEGRRGFAVQAQFQGTLALLSRMSAVRTIDVKTAQKLVEQLLGVPLADGGEYAGALARWFRDTLLPAIPRADTSELAVLAALSGAASGDGTNVRRVTWEGVSYRLDLGASERQRLQRVREKQESAVLDVGIELAVAARALGNDKMSLDDAQAIAERLSALAADIPRRVGRDVGEATPPGVSAPPNASEAVKRAVDELTRQVKAKDLKRAARVGETFNGLADELLAQTLPSIAYAADVGDPDGTVLLADDVSRRHDFGFGAKDAEVRLRSAWAVPRPEVTPGVPWHVNGSLLGLDIALAPLALRRLNYERVLEAPKLTSNERDSFALSVSLMNPFHLRDADRDAIADAIGRGRRRVAGLRTVNATGATATAAEAAFGGVADEISMEGWRRRAIRWMLAHEGDRVPTMFSATELLVLGGGRPADFDAWGMAMVTAQGCACSRLTPPGGWPTLLGRPPLGLTASAVADMNLHIAIMLRELRLPAAIAKVVLAGAMQDFIDEVKPTDDSDWLTLARTVRSFTRERIEDYVSAATAGGPLMPEQGRSGAYDR
jgi:hypothetical protein